MTRGLERLSTGGVDRNFDMAQTDPDNRLALADESEADSILKDGATNLFFLTDCGASSDISMVGPSPVPFW